MSEVVIHRGDLTSRDRLRTHKVFLDEQLVGTLKVNSEVRVSAPPGPHSLQIRVDWASSPTLDFTLYDGEARRFETGPDDIPTDLVGAMIAITFRRRSYLWLKAADSPRPTH